MRSIKRHHTVSILAFVTLALAPRQTGASTIATIDLTYSGIDQTGEGANISGSGNFSLAVGSSPNIGAVDLSSFAFSQTATVPNLGISTFNYGLGDLTSFSLNLSSVAAPSLSLSTDAVGGADPDFDPESVSASGGTAQTFNDSGVLLSSGTLTLDQSSVCAATLAGAVDPVSLGTKFTATFTPHFGTSLSQAEAACGVSGFNWQQTMTVPNPSPYFAPGSNVPLTGTWIDPPPGGYDTGEHSVAGCPRARSPEFTYRRIIGSPRCSGYARLDDRFGIFDNLEATSRQG